MLFWLIITPLCLFVLLWCVFKIKDTEQKYLTRISNPVNISINEQMRREKGRK